MIHKGRTLTPAASDAATATNYTWHNGIRNYPHRAGYVFTSKEAIAEQIYDDYPEGVPVGIWNTPTIMGAGCVIGGNGFGWYGDPPKRFPHIGGVVFGKDVELGSNVTIDRGALGDTTILDNVKIDNGVHVGHNARIGRNSILTAHCIIGGSANIAEKVWVGLGAIIKNQITVGAGATIGMGAIVVKNVEPGVTVVGNPARPM